MEKSKNSKPEATSILKHRTRSPEETRLLGKKIGKKLNPGAVIALIGELGAGKTVFSQGILKGLGVKDRYMISPSFVLVKEYRGRLPVHHIDLFRLKDKKEIERIGISEYIFGKGVTIIEWAEKAREFLPEDYLEVRIRFKKIRRFDKHQSIDVILFPSNRIIYFSPKGKKSSGLLSL